MWRGGKVPTSIEATDAEAAGEIKVTHQGATATTSCCEEAV
jgi:hypothetical protein